MRPLRNKRAGMSLLEVMSGLVILSIISVGVLASLLQSRALTEGSIFQNTAVTAAQGYIEQIKNMEFSELDNHPLQTWLDQDTPDPLEVSPLPRSEATQVVNHRLIDLNNTPDNPDDDMPLDVVVYIENLTDPANEVGESRLITLIYTWEFNRGSATRRFTNTVSCIRSEVPTIP